MFRKGNAIRYMSLVYGDLYWDSKPEGLLEQGFALRTFLFSIFRDLFAWWGILNCYIREIFGSLSNLRILSENEMMILNFVRHSPFFCQHYDFYIGKSNSIEDWGKYALVYRRYEKSFCDLRNFNEETKLSLISKLLDAYSIILDIKRYHGSLSFLNFQIDEFRNIKMWGFFNAGKNRILCKKF